MCGVKNRGRSVQSEISSREGLPGIYSRKSRSLKKSSRKSRKKLLLKKSLWNLSRRARKKPSLEKSPWNPSRGARKKPSLEKSLWKPIKRNKKEVFPGESSRSWPSHPRICKRLRIYIFTWNTGKRLIIPWYIRVSLPSGLIKYKRWSSLGTSEYPCQVDL